MKILLPLFCLCLFPQSSLLAGSYWQQDVHYTIDATLNPNTAVVSGSERLVYTNNSPDTLRTVYFRLYWNAFTKGSRGEEFQRENKSYYWNTTGGITVKKIAVLSGTAEETPVFKIDNTIMQVDLPRPLLPGDSTTFLIDYEGRVIAGGNRTGHQGRDFDIAQWYPQIAVYDQYGWDKNQYLTPAEFHNEYGAFDISITLPRSFVLGHCGEIVNPEEVYPDSVRRHLQEALAVDTTVNILDYSHQQWTEADTTPKTWKFHADHVTDFAWSANEHYIWDVECWHPGDGSRVIPIHALYFEDKRQYWKETAHFGKHAVSFFSTHYGMFTFPNMFVIEGTEGGGMEYPGLTFLGHFGDPVSHTLHDVAAHEIGHNWYPMMLQSNETYYGFMDEGFNTFITATCIEDFYGRYHQQDWAGSWVGRFFHFEPDDERLGMQRGTIDLEKTGHEEPIATHVYRFKQQNLFGESIYGKTASVMFMLQYVLGDSVFSRCMHEYYNRYRFKHVYPEDFYRTMEEVSGRKDLRWFFNEWFERTFRCDYGVCGLGYHEAKDGGETVYKTHFTVHRYEQAIMPVDVRVTMRDGSAQTVWFPIDQWLNGESENDTTIDLASPPVRADLNPDGRILDVNRMNNSTSFPPVKLQFDNTMWSVTPVDSYLVLWRPSFWYTDEGGVKIGAKVTGSYLTDFTRTTLGGWYNTREHTLDYDLGLSENTTFISPLSRVSGRVFRLEGRKGVEFTLSKTVQERMYVLPAHTFTFRYGYLKATNREYLLDPSSWEDGNLQRIIAGYQYSNRWEGWNLDAFLTLEGSLGLLGQNDFSYSKRNIEIRTSTTLIPAFTLALRLYDGAGYGTLPAQVKYSLADASPADMMNAPFFRSKGPFPSGIRDHAQYHGGGDMRGYLRAQAGDNIEAFNAEARFNTLLPFVDQNIPLLGWMNRRIKCVLFADAGRIASGGTELQNERFEADLGFGFRLNSFWPFIDQLSGSGLLNGIGLNMLRVDFPIYVTMPPAGEEKLKFRWVVGVNEIF